MSDSSKNLIPKPIHFGLISVPRAIIGCMILVGILINVANVIGRYMFLEPIIWAEEIMIYIMVWTVFIGAILVTFDGQHLKMDATRTAFLGNERANEMLTRVYRKPFEVPAIT